MGGTRRIAMSAAQGDRRHVALLIHSGDGGGAQRVMTTLAGALAERGHRVDLVACRAEGPILAQLPACLRLVSLRASPWGRGRLAAFAADPRALRELARPVLLPLATSEVFARLPDLARYLREDQPEILLSAKVHTNLLALLARRRSGAATRIVVSERGDSADKVQHSRRWRWRHIVPLIRRLYSEADGIVSVSEALAGRFAARTGIPRERITVVHNPVVSDALFEQAKAPLRHPWFDPGAPPVILAAGRLEPRKGFATLLRAFARLRQERPARLMIFGEGPERGPLERLARDLGLEGTVELPGWTDELFPHMARAAVFVLSSTYEGLPGVLIQALACGCPVVSTDCPTGPAEILEDGRYGRLVPVGDEAALAEAIVATLDHPPEREALRARGREFSVERAAGRYLDLFASLPQPAAVSAPTAVGVAEVPTPSSSR